MAQTNVILKECDACGEQDGTKKYGEIGWLCEDCIDSYEKIEDNETEMSNDLSADWDDENTWDDAITEDELRHEGFDLSQYDEDDEN